MNYKKVIVLRGCANSGKSTVAKLFGDNAVICTADDYFTDDQGNYNFNPLLLGAAHYACQEKYLKALDDFTIDTVVCANTNTKSSEFQFYIDEAEKRGIMVFSLVVEKRHNNENNHQVPVHVIDRHEQNIKNTLRLR
jgi:predicted kinase